MIEASRTELSGILLDFEHIHSNMIFSHANTLLPEYWSSMLKKMIEELEYKSISTNKEIYFDLNQDYSHLNDE